jgi:F-type H+-transporting ATPase subunit epsilon
MNPAIMKLHLEITTPEKTVFQQEVDSVTVPTREGEITVLPSHASLVSLVAPGALTIRVGNEEQFLAVSGGAIQILPGSKCIILTDSADRAEDLVAEEIEKAKARAQATYDEARGKDDVAYADASVHLERELARLKVVRKHRRDGNMPKV